MKAREIMTTKVLAIRADDLAEHAVQIMAQHHVSGLPVVNEADELVGIVTERDLLLIQKTEPPLMPTALYGLWLMPARMVEESAKMRGLRVSDVMTRQVITFGPDDSVLDIARTMKDRGIKRVPILEDGKLVGIVSRQDIIHAIAEGKPLD